MKKNVILLDMDGTITPARKHIEYNVSIVLTDLTRYAKIGIVSGSDIQYILEQCGNYFIQNKFAHQVDLLPCNGTKFYTYESNISKYIETFSVSMKEEISELLYRDLVSSICKAQSKLVKTIDIPISGNFISYRGSTINWCPIGRQVSFNERETFSKNKNKDLIRLEAIKDMWSNLDYFKELNDKIEVALAGQTSIDIFPKGWDKTFALKHFQDKNVYFIGDRCEKGGIDYHIYEALKPYGRSFKTSGPKQTVEILDNLRKSFILKNK